MEEKKSSSSGFTSSEDPFEVNIKEVRCDTHNPEEGRCFTSQVTWVEMKSCVKKMIERIKKFFNPAGFDHFCEG